MKFRMVVSFLFLGALGLNHFAIAQEVKTALAERHAARNIQCAACHQEMPPKPFVPQSKCLQCHGSYSALAEKTTNLEINPHKSHMGKPECVKCHKGHKPGQLVCNECHQFEVKVP